jgi:rare lipoprotein A
MPPTPLFDKICTNHKSESEPTRRIAAVMRLGGEFIAGLAFAGCICASLLLGCQSKPSLRAKPLYEENGIASYYSNVLQGKPTASGEYYDKKAMTAAHGHLPFGTYVVVTNLQNKKKVKVRINDRGPFVRGRIIDVSYAAAQKLGMIGQGLIEVHVLQVK